jgi:hypothetical protein
MPGDLMLRDVAIRDVYVMGFITMPVLASIAAAPSVTPAHAVAVPLAQYVKESEVVPEFGIYVKVPFALRVNEPWVGGVET